MTARSTMALLALLTLPTVAPAQHGGATGPAVPTPPREATQFDFLVGQWELDVHPQATTVAQRMHGMPNLIGTWKAWRALDGWGVEDEMRITDASGNPLAMSHTVRFYDVGAKHWSNSTLDVYRARYSMGTAESQDGSITVTTQGTDTDGKAYVSRTRYYDVTPSSFKYQADRSYDAGKTWNAVLKMDAKRVAATASR